MMKKITVLMLITMMLMTMASCGAKGGKGVDEIKQKNQTMGISVHDPNVVKDEDTYYIFGSHMEAAKTTDLINFKSFASGVNKSNKLFDNLFTDEMEAFSFVGKYQDGGYAVWAPTVIYNKAMEKYVMYFSTSRDYRTSTISMATADTIEGPYHYEAQLIHSGYSRVDVDKTNFYEILGEDAKVTDYLTAGKYNNLKYPNCIDPAVFYDEEGKMWMVYGSWSGGIWLLELDEATGLPIHPEADEEKHIDTYYGQYLMGGLHNSCEGPFILYDEQSGYYYLLVSYGELTREGGYQIRQYRAETVTGPYVDAAGQTFDYVVDHSEFGLKMMGNYALPSLKTAYMAPGHCSAIIDTDGAYYLVYHTRFDSGSEYHEPRVHQMFVNEDGWLVAAPFATTGAVTCDAYTDIAQLEGNYYVLNHRKDIGAQIHDAQKMKVDKDGKVKLEDGSKGELVLSEQNGYVSLELDGVIYKGVVFDMQDEAGNEARCITASGSNNETVWAVLYK